MHNNYKGISQETSELFKKHYIALPDKEIEDSLGKGNDMDLNRFVDEGLRGTALNFDAVIGSTGIISNSSDIIAVRKASGEHSSAASDRFEEMIEERHDSVVEIKVPDHTEKSLNIMFVNSSKGLASKVKITVGAEAKLSILEWYTSINGDVSFSGIVHRVETGDGSDVEINALHSEGYATVSAYYFNDSIGKNSKLIANSVYIGGSHVRVRNAFDADARGSSIEVNEVALGVNAQKFDIMSKISNIGEGTKAILSSSAVMDGAATCFLKGYAKIHHGAKTAISNIHQEGLLLGKESKIVALPDMSIDESDVKASHAASAGPLDEDKMFYMMSRGIGAAGATGLITAAFLAKVVSRMRNPVARELAMSMVLEKIEDGSCERLPKIKSLDIWASDDKAGK